MRHVVMFSSGTGSAVAAKRVADRYGTENLVLLFADVNGEHGDNYRFLLEAARWIGGRLVVLNNDGKTIWQIFSESHFLGNTRVDLCSRQLKREPMRAWLEQNCTPNGSIVYLGYDWTEERRWAGAKKFWAPWWVECPLGMASSTKWAPLVDKQEGLEMLRVAGIEPPLLTAAGFHHANCGGGCVKAGVKQFVKLLRFDPNEYAKWEWHEQKIRWELGRDVAILRDRTGGKTRPLTLRELRETVEESKPLAFGGAEDDWGACNCLTPIDESEE